MISIDFDISLNLLKPLLHQLVAFGDVTFVCPISPKHALCRRTASSAIHPDISGTMWHISTPSPPCCLTHVPVLLLLLLGSPGAKGSKMIQGVLRFHSLKTSHLFQSKNASQLQQRCLRLTHQKIGFQFGRKLRRKFESRNRSGAISSASEHPA